MDACWYAKKSRRNLQVFRIANMFSTTSDIQFHKKTSDIQIRETGKKVIRLKRPISTVLMRIS